MNRIIYTFFYILLFSPILAYIYIVFFDLPKTITHFYVFLIFAFGIIYFIYKDKVKYPRFIVWLLFYAIYRLCWTFFSESSLHPLTFVYYCILNFSTLFIIIIIYNTNFNETTIKKYSKIISFTIFIATIVSIVQVFDRDFLNAWEYFGAYNLSFDKSIYTFRRASIFGFIDPNDIGLSFIPLSSVFIGSLLKNQQKEYILFTILIAIIAFLTNTRYVMMGFVILSMQYIFFFKFKIKNIIFYGIFGIAIFFSILFFLLKVGYDIDTFYRERLFAEESIVETTRYKAIETFKEFFPKKPILGTGVHLTEEIKEASIDVGSSQIHVGYLSHLVSYGIIGSFLLFGFWFNLAKHLYRNAKRTKYWGAFFAFQIFFFAQATLVNYSIFTTGLLFAFVFDKYYIDLYFHEKNYY